MTQALFQSAYHRKSRARLLQEAVLGVFRGGGDAVVERLSCFSERDWRRAYAWLDASGVALYFLHRLDEMDAQSAIPPRVLARFRQNHADNSVRTGELLREMALLGCALQQVNVRYAVIKGATLAPASVPDVSLRCQLDLDFVVAPDAITIASSVLQEQGYKLHAVSGDTWEFKTPSIHPPRRKDLYKAKPQRSVELHVESNDARLARGEQRNLYGCRVPVLGAADMFVEQALHLFSHVSGEFTRASWVLEYARHIRFRYQDSAFWSEVHALAEQVPEADVRIGVVTLLASEVFDVDAPPILRRWTIDRLSPAVRLWVILYGREIVLARFPGSKLYLMLREILGGGSAEERAERRARLLPMHVAPAITPPAHGQRFKDRLLRKSMQWWYLAFRMRFHLVEGFRYSLEVSRWRRRTAELLS